MSITSYRHLAREGAGEIAYHVQRSDALVQDHILRPDTIRACLDKLSKPGGDLAYSPEIVARVGTVLERRFDTDIGADLFSPPNYGVYEDPEIAAFYGVNTSETTNIQTRKETFEEQRERLIDEVVREVEPELAGLAQMMNHYRAENYPRHGIADEAPYVHADPDLTLLRNPDRGWCAMDTPVSTSQKRNVVDMYEAVPNYTFPTPHPGWEVDRPKGFWSSLG